MILRGVMVYPVEAARPARVKCLRDIGLAVSDPSFGTAKAIESYRQERTSKR